MPQLPVLFHLRRLNRFRFFEDRLA